MAGCVGYRVMESPIGSLLIASTEKGVCLIEFGAGETAMFSLGKWCRRWRFEVKADANADLNRQAIRQLEQYFSGTRQAFELPLDLYGTPFQKKVWLELLKIPYGEVRTYKDIALAIGAARAVRAVGGANNQNPVPIVIPCHRVIGSNGALVGYGGGLSIKEALLRLEGCLPSKDAAAGA
ncbi:MAG: methylated-DNA--[protein]-cysteine S-methyltransferase [Brevibacillus sp.]|nr:methylated-DNA--[protein]-cysteine S-methyltransferase [Brevibacillus sp.]